jgi:hypothetical protein
MKKNILLQSFIYVIIILSIPLFIDLLFKLTIRRKRKNILLHKALSRSKKTNKPLIIFNNYNEGFIIKTTNNERNEEKIDDNIEQLLPKLKDNSCVLLISETLEYVDNVDQLIKETIRVSNFDLYISNFEKKSLRFYYDPYIKQIMDKPYYMGKYVDIKWASISPIQSKIRNVYKHVLKIFPKKYILYDPIYTQTSTNQLRLNTTQS